MQSAERVLTPTLLSSATAGSIVSAAIPAAAATAATFAAFMSRAAVRRANLAFVWADFEYDQPDRASSMRRLRVQLHSDGPGIALDVRWSVDGPPECGRAARRKAEKEVAHRATPAIRALRPGESHPPLAIAAAEAANAASYERSQRSLNDPHDDSIWWIRVRWSDSAGQRWELSESSAGRELAGPPTKVRRQLVS